MSVTDLPHLNAVLNTVSATLLAAGYAFIRSARPGAHRLCMLAALACSGAFLTSYLVYHFQVGSVRFQGQGWVRTVYFGVLITHVVLAIVIVPLVATTVTRILRRNVDGHRRLARVTLPLWFYVSVTGVVIYWMLYQLR